MPSHRIQKDWKARRKTAVPFGLGQAKLKCFRDMAVIVRRASVPVKGTGFREVLTPSPF